MTDTALKGGPGSGNFNHAGRPDLVGGSAPTASNPAGRAAQPQTATATPAAPAANPFITTDARGIEWRTDRKCDPAVVADAHRLVDAYPDWAISEIKRIRLCGRPGKAFTAGGQAFTTAAEYTASTRDIALYNANSADLMLDADHLLDHEVGHSLETALFVYAQRGRTFASAVAQTTGQARTTMERGRDKYAPWVKVADALDAARAKKEDGVSEYSKAWWKEGEHQGQAETLAVLTTHYFGSAPGARGKTPADRVRNACKGQAEALGEAYLAGLALLKATYQARGKKAAGVLPPAHRHRLARGHRRVAKRAGHQGDRTDRERRAGRDGPGRRPLHRLRRAPGSAGRPPNYRAPAFQSGTSPGGGNQMTTTTKFFKTVDEDLVETTADDAEVAVELTFGENNQLVSSRWFTALEPGAATKEADEDEDDGDAEWEAAELEDV